MAFKMITSILLDSVFYLSIALLIFSIRQQEIIDKLDPNRAEDEEKETDFYI
jgi:hypothetical protein